MHNNSYLKMPGVETKFETGKNENNILKGNFNLDLGNGSFIFLRSQGDAVQTFLANNPKLEIRNVYNKSTGISTGVALVLDYCKLCNFKNKDILVPITNVLPKFTTDGLIGLKFFETVIAVFDFGESGFYIKSSR